MPSAPSPSQSATSRANGARSHSPIIDAGKAASSQNAAHHGICAARLEVDGPAAEHLAWHLEAAMRAWEPGTAFERRLVHDLAIIALKLARLDTLELKAPDAAIEGSDVRYPSLASLARYRRALKRENDETEGRLIRAQEHRHAEEDAAEEAEIVAEAAAAQPPAADARMSEPERRPATGPTHGPGAATLRRAGVDVGGGG